ncbi:MAG: hypothetical protein ABI351_12440 [Herbaspirillum sp.]
MNEIPPLCGDSDSRYMQIPGDFPKVDIASSVAGFQNKLALTQYGGKYYVPGNTPDERYRQWCVCEDITQRYVIECRESKAKNYSHLTEQELLRGCYESAIQAAWGISREQMIYAFRRVAAELGWPPPELPDEASSSDVITVKDSTIDEVDQPVVETSHTPSSVQRLLKQYDSRIKKCK